MEGGVFEEAVEQDDEFAHDGGEGHFQFFSGGSEALMEARRMGSWRTALRLAMPQVLREAEG